LTSKKAFLTANVVALSIVSLLADLSTEMIVPILPLFLVGTLGASYSIVGLIEGSSDSASSLMKVVAVIATILFVVHRIKMSRTL